METTRSRRGYYGTLSNSSGPRFDSDGARDARSSRAGSPLATVVLRVARGLRRAARSALPQSCALCAAPSGAALLCEACERALPHLGAACPRCALPSSRATLCAACLRDPPPFDAATAAWIYAWPADRLLQEFKYGGRLALAEPLGEALARACRRDRDARADAGPDGGADGGTSQRAWPDVLVAIPLTPARQRGRGFNQAQEIARSLGAELALPVARWLERVRDAPPQAAQGVRGRRGSVRGVFVADPRVAGASVAIVDDVMTTGATLAAAAAALRAAGARRIEAWAVARTPAPEPLPATALDPCSTSCSSIPRFLRTPAT